MEIRRREVDTVGLEPLGCAVRVSGPVGDLEVAVQRSGGGEQALMAADVEVTGGADGVYGNDTMAAVAEYQRSDDLQVTGVVDMATARALGVYREFTDEAPATRAPATTALRSALSATFGDVDEPTGSDNAVCPVGSSSHKQ